MPCPSSNSILPGALGAVQETMLIPLWARARETARADALVRDEEAVEILSAMRYDFTRFERAWKTQVGVAVRTRFIDEAVRTFVASHPDAVVVNLGCGLDTRFRRVDNGRLRWIDLDTPDAIALRRRCVRDEPDRVRDIAASAFDDSWIEPLARTSPPQMLFVAEGVLMFFPRARVLALLGRLADAFPGSEIIFDCIGTWMVRMPWLHDTLPKTRAEFAWGLGDRRELERWSTRCSVLRTRSMLDEAPRRWRWMRWFRFVPGFADQFLVTHVRLG